MRKSALSALVLMSGASAPLVGDNYSLNNHWNVLGEFVFMRRSEIHNHALVKDANKFQCPNRCPDFTVMNTKNLVNDFDFEPGYRVGLTYMQNPRISFEGNFLWVAEWEGEKTVHGDQSLSFPFKDSSFTQDFNNASEAKGEYKSNFWDAEFNFWRHFNPRRVDYFCLSMIAGLRYFHLDESFKLTMVKPPDTSSYHTHTSNKMLGAQVGLDFQMNPTRWLSWEMFAKVGGMANHTESRILLKDQNNQVTLRHSEKQERELGVFADVAAQFTIYCANWLNFHAGYEALFFSGLALAPEQISRNTKSHSGKKDYTHGNAVIHGLYTGLTFSF
jgi:hypothetical protein